MAATLPTASEPSAPSSFAPNSQAMPPMRTTLADGLAVHVIGKPLTPYPLPPPIFLVPDPYGFVDFAAHPAHGPLFTHLGRDRTVISFDPPGSGKSTRKPRVSMDEMLSAVKETLTHVGVSQPVDFIGHSQSAIVALAVALYRPDLVRRLVLVSGAAGYPSMSHSPGAIWNSTHPLHSEYLRRMALFYLFRRRGFETAVIKTINASAWHAQEEGARRFEYDWMTDHMGRKLTLAKFLERPRPRTLWFARVLSQLDYTARLHDVKVPTLAVCGRHDTQCPPACTEELVDHIPGAQGAIFESSGLYPFVDERDEFWKVVEEFLEEDLLDKEVDFFGD